MRGTVILVNPPELFIANNEISSVINSFRQFPIDMMDVILPGHCFNEDFIQKISFKKIVFCQNLIK